MGTEEGEGRTKGRERERESDKGIVRLHVPERRCDKGEEMEEGRKFVETSLRGRFVRRHDSWNKRFGKL